MMNMQKKTIRTLLAFLSLAACPVLTGCSTDDGIDLGDIDTTIAVGSDGLTFPSSSTNHVKLSDVLDLKENGVIDTLENGDYRFQKTGDINPARPKVAQITIDQRRAESFDFPSGGFYTAYQRQSLSDSQFQL